MRIFLAVCTLCIALLSGLPAFGQAAMIFGSDAAGAPDTVALPQNTELWFTTHSSTTGEGTVVPSYWANKVGGELSAIIQGYCGLPLNATTMGQYSQISGCLAAQHGRLLGVATLTLGASSYTGPANASFYDIEIVGGGGGGGNAAATSGTQVSVGSGGAAGSYAHVIILSSSLGMVSVSIGAPGSGGAGGTTSFGSYASCPGGGQGGSGLAATIPAMGQVGQGLPGAPCTVGTGTAALVTTGGQPGLNGLLLGSSVASGQGAGGPWGGGGQNTNTGAGAPASGPGAGGSGAACAAGCGGYSGGAGAAGLIIVRAYS